jgi:hypothetical protein
MLCADCRQLTLLQALVLFCAAGALASTRQLLQGVYFVDMVLSTHFSALAAQHCTLPSLPGTSCCCAFPRPSRGTLFMRGLLQGPAAGTNHAQQV